MKSIACQYKILVMQELAGGHLASVFVLIALSVPLIVMRNWVRL